MTESELIERYFLGRPGSDKDIPLGIGDDAAILNVPNDHQVVVSTDTLVAGVHFDIADKAEDVGYKTLAVNLSDMAAMAAEPKWLSLSLTMPALNEKWLKGFCHGFFSLAEKYDLNLIGGDLSSGPLSISITIQGLVPEGQYIARSGAKEGDDIYVTGTLGNAAAGLKFKQAKTEDEAHDHLQSSLLRPTARVELGMVLRPHVHSMIDISDGLAQDLGHILNNSQCGAEVQLEKIPLSESIKKLTMNDEALSLALSGGDDYELCFTAAKEKANDILALADKYNCPITQIGMINNSRKLTLFNIDGTEFQLRNPGYQHFL